MIELFIVLVVRFLVTFHAARAQSTFVPSACYRLSRRKNWRTIGRKIMFFVPSAEDLMMAQNFSRDIMKSVKERKRVWKREEL